MHYLLVWVSALSFLFFGVGCFISGYMRSEFTRYRLSGQRQLVGALQLMGAAGLLVGIEYPVIGQVAAAGLTLLMLLGVCVRIRIRDSVLQTTPALFYMLLNGYLCIAWPFLV
jgi:hypothetical protein